MDYGGGGGKCANLILSVTVISTIIIVKTFKTTVHDKEKRGFRINTSEAGTRGRWAVI